ncbi:MAG TPA: YceI family protein [Thermoanaerobaculia bacterium]|nr:YceI family protein [Thermoanaerobaculia bacterium]
MFKQSSVFLLLTLTVLPACKSELDNKPDAAIVETSTTSTEVQAPAVAVVTTTHNVIKEKSSIRFVGAKVTEDHPGMFKQFDGKIAYAGNKPVSVEFDIDVTSVDTKIAKLDGHLKSPDFFDVANHPKATFRSTSIEPGAGDGTYTVTGNLNLRGEEKTISFPASVMMMPDSVHATSEFKINRQDYKVSYTGAADNLIKDDVLIKLDLHFPPPPPA